MPIAPRLNHRPGSHTATDATTFGIARTPELGIAIASALQLKRVDAKADCGVTLVDRGIHRCGPRSDHASIVCATPDRSHHRRGHLVAPLAATASAASVAFKAVSGSTDAPYTSTPERTQPALAVITRPIANVSLFSSLPTNGILVASRSMTALGFERKTCNVHHRVGDMLTSITGSTATHRGCGTPLVI